MALPENGNKYNARADFAIGRFPTQIASAVLLTGMTGNMSRRHVSLCLSLVRRTDAFVDEIRQ